jgi:hypothetical protein
MEVWLEKKQLIFEMAEQNINFGGLGMDLEQSLSQIKKGKLTYAMNGMLEGFDGQYVNYQNEQGNVECVTFPENFLVIGRYPIYEQNKIIYWLTNPATGDNQIGSSPIEGCEYTAIIQGKCLNFDVNHPIRAAVHRSDNCSTQIFWVDGYNRDRFIDLENLPFKEIVTDNSCDNDITSEIDCNKLSMNPFFSIPKLRPTSVESDGSLQAGTYQFAIQYANVNGSPYTSFYSVTNPISIFDPNVVTLDFNYTINRSIKVSVEQLDRLGYYDYYNLAVIKTVQSQSTVDLIGTFPITSSKDSVIYTGQSLRGLAIDDIFLKYAIYEKSNDLTTAQDVLIRDQLTAPQRLSYQKIANQITVQWQTWLLGADLNYSNPLITANVKGYMRDEIYPFEIQFQLGDGRETDRFHIPGRIYTANDLTPVSNQDTVDGTLSDCDDPTALPRWKVYNTGSLIGKEQDYLTGISGGVFYDKSTGETIITDKASCYAGPYEYGDMAYWESEEKYPCNPEIWGELANQPIRHHKFPDSLITHIHDDKGNIFPIGIKIDVQQVYNLIQNSSLTQEQKDAVVGFKILHGNRANNKSVVAKGLINNVGKYNNEEGSYYFPNYPYNDVSNGDDILRGVSFGDFSKQRFVLHSPDTHFYQPTLGTILKLETAEYGLNNAHIRQVKNHPKYQMLAAGAYYTSFQAGGLVAVANALLIANSPFGDPWVTMQFVIDLFEKTMPRLNYAYQFNSIGTYDKYKPVANDGNKQRAISTAEYLTPSIQSVNDDLLLNNWQRESSVYVKTQTTLPYTNSITGVPQDTSRQALENNLCKTNDFISDISSYYASVKKASIAQYGQIYSYESIDTGAQIKFSPINTTLSVFGGDVFINRFAYKTKLPFFTQNVIGLPDETPMFYDEWANVGEPVYYISSNLGSGLDDDTGGFLKKAVSQVFNLINKVLGIEKINLACGQAIPYFYKKGKFFLFAYGIPYFYCESEVNVDYRQAFNDKEGDFWPHVSTGIPDEWLQEVNVSITNDNTYYYNRTYSKQNKENFFSFLPPDFSTDSCQTVFPYRAIFSEPRTSKATEIQNNNWLIYKPVSFYDFPQNFGKLTGLDGLEYKQVLARFENRSQIYNAFLTAPTNQADIYLGQTLFSQQVPPIDLSNTDMGYIGSRHKFLLKTEYGVVTVDDKRGHVFLIQGTQAKNLTSIESGVEQFFNKNLEIQLVKHFPTLPVDNNYNGVGIHGVYDAKYNRLILTKIDYTPFEGVVYLNNKFYVNAKEIILGDPNYFCNKSFTISYDFDYQCWVSFHSYIPSFYTGSGNFFLSTKSGKTWKHHSTEKFCSFYNEIHPYIIEYPYAFQFQDEILQSISDYTKTLQYIGEDPIEVDDVWFNKAILYNNQQCSGILNLARKPRNNMSEYMKYPIYSPTGKTILYTKSDNFYKINQFWSLVKDPRQPLFKKSCKSLSFDKEVNQENMNYSKMAFKKAPLRAKDLKCRFILDNRTDTRLVSQLIATETQKSFK